MKPDSHPRMNISICLHSQLHDLFVSNIYMENLITISKILELNTNVQINKNTLKRIISSWLHQQFFPFGP